MLLIENRYPTNQMPTAYIPTLNTYESSLKE